MTGTISLYNPEGRRLSFYRYGKPAHRRAILSYWKSLYAERFKTYYTQISPDIDEANLLHLPPLKKAS